MVIHGVAYFLLTPIKKPLSFHYIIRLMDEVDFRLCLLLRENSRIPYRELADEVGLSVNAVHSRVSKLKESGIIDGFCAMFGDGAIKESLKILIHGESRAENMEDVLKELSQDKNTYKMFSTSDDYLYIHGTLQDLSKMSDYVECVPDVAEIEDPEIFLPSFHKKDVQDDFELKRTDYEIINSLRQDSRKALSEVGDEICVSTKTVRRRIDRMEEANAIGYSIKWYPIYSDDFIGLMHCGIDKGVRDKILSEIKNRYYPNVFEVEKASNHPDKVMIKIWGNSLDEIKDMRKELKSKEYFDCLKTRMFYDIEYFKNWKDELLKEKMRV